MLNWANRVTFFRLFCTPIIVGLLLHYREQINLNASASELFNIRLTAIILLCLAIISDAADGFIARVYKQKTLLGAILDPFADKLLLMSTTIILSIPLGFKYKIPSWLVVTIISRDILILAGALILYLLFGKIKFSPLLTGKITTFLQMVTVFLVLIQHSVCTYFFYITFVFTIVSGINYIYRETKLINNQTL
ncbi:CDP-alcohol phosphatidyltransferase family protein [bacterium]|nr:CDP-alcohol phosphatidyltransferase family protein [bacterium]